MTVPFEYPGAAHQRRHGPRGYADYASYLPWLRDEFMFRCVYCLQRERWVPPAAALEIDHFLPVALNPELTTDYTNLLYCCSTCNTAKRTRSLPDPTAVLLRHAVDVDPDGMIRPRTPEAERLVIILGLDSPTYNEFRLLWIGIVAMAERHAPDLYRRLMGFPSVLPDLATLRPPGGNTRPEGIASSCHQERLRGDLPDTY
jgi:HNH endonuclease